MKSENTQSCRPHCLSVGADEIILNLIQSMEEGIGLFVQSFQNPVQALQYTSDNVVGITDAFLSESVEVRQVLDSLQGALAPVKMVS